MQGQTSEKVKPTDGFRSNTRDLIDVVVVGNNRHAGQVRSRDAPAPVVDRKVPCPRPRAVVDQKPFRSINFAERPSLKAYIYHVHMSMQRHMPHGH